MKHRARPSARPDSAASPSARVSLAAALLLGAGLGVWLWQGTPTEPAQQAAAPAPAAAAPAPAPGAPAETARHADLPGGMAKLVAGLLDGSPTLSPESLRTALERAMDGELDPERRARAIRALAAFGNDEALDVLERLLRGDPSIAIRTVVARALGKCTHPDALRLLRASLGDPAPSVAAAAALSLGRLRHPEALDALRSLLEDPGAPESLRAAAAVAMADHPEAHGALRELAASSNAALAAAALEGLAGQAFAENEALLRSALAGPQLGLDAKLPVVEALADGDADAMAYLVELAGGHREPELRTAAIEALALGEDGEGSAAGLAAIAQHEPEPEVRAALYNALSVLPPEPADPRRAGLVAEALGESEPRARLEGSRMLASWLRRSPDPDLARSFDASAVDWLRESAESGSRFTRHLATHTLLLAGTTAARDALRDLSHSSDPAVSEPAERALRRIAQAR